MEEQGTQRQTIEALLEQLGELAGAPQASNSFELWVPKALVMEGETVPIEDAMAIIDDAAHAHGYESAGYSESQSGRLYRYVRATDEEPVDSWSLSGPLTWIVLAAVVAGFLIITFR